MKYKEKMTLIELIGQKNIIRDLRLLNEDANLQNQKKVELETERIRPNNKKQIHNFD